MLKALGYTPRGKMLVIGLSRKNCELLLKEKPIMFDARIQTIDCDVMIMGGESEHAMAYALQKQGIEVGSKAPHSGALRPTVDIAEIVKPLLECIALADYNNLVWRADLYKLAEQAKHQLVGIINPEDPAA